MSKLATDGRALPPCVPLDGDCLGVAEPTLSGALPLRDILFEARNNLSLLYWAGLTSWNCRTILDV